MMVKNIPLVVILIQLTFSAPTLMAQISANDTLYLQIMKGDSLLFEAGFNNCHLDALYKVTDENFEFYHDQSGYNFGQEKFIDGIRKNICSLSYRPKRKLKEESTEIYPLQSNGTLYGAIQQGVHDFYAVEADKEPYLTSTAKFTHLWIKSKSRWVLRRVLSYDHKAPETPSADESDRLFENREEIEKWLKKNKVPALALAKIEHYRLSKLNIYGHLYDDQKAAYNSLFNVASLTKPVVAVLVLKLIDRGDWDLDEPLYHYWTDPDVLGHPFSKKITTRHVLSHQTGFSNWRWQDETKKLTFNFEPGTDYSYSGEGFEYLKKSLESKFQQPLEILVDSILFQPLKMTETQFYWTDQTAEALFAKWHNNKGENEYATYKNKEANAADDLLTTIEDYGKFAEYVINGAGLSAELFQQMTTQQNGTDHQTKMGLSWEILPNLKGKEYAIMHTGGDIGVNTLVILLPLTGEGLVIFTNADNGKNLYFRLIEEHLSLGKRIIGKAQ